MLDGEVDLIVTDIQMPGGGGIALARAVRKAYPSVPIILVSGHGDPDTEFEFIAKPFSWTVMSRAIRRVVCRAA